VLTNHIEIPELDNVELLRKESSKHEYPDHYHETFCVTLIKSGTLTESEFILPTGAIVIAHPFEVHNNELIRDVEYAFTTFYLSPDLFSTLIGETDCSFEDKVIYDESLFNSFDRLANALLIGNCESADKQELTNILYSNLASLTLRHSTPKPFHTLTKPKLIDEIKNLILENLDTKMSIEKLAGKVGMGKYKFIRWFKKHVGLTPYDFIILNRILAGQKMIREGKPLLNAAMDTGFYDQSHFSNYFKRFIGLTPKSYQQSCNIFQYSQ